MKTKNLPALGMELPKLYTVIWKDEADKFKYLFSNNIDVCEKKAALNDGTIYIDNRYAAKLRLYWYLIRKALYPVPTLWELEMSLERAIIDNNTYEIARLQDIIKKRYLQAA